MCDEARLRCLEMLVQEQARLIEELRAHGPTGLFQRRRLRKMWLAGRLAKYITEDELRMQNQWLKKRIRELSRNG